jgi:predicted component of type VI protein secretion system
MEKQRRGLIKKYHVLCGQLRLSVEDRRALLASNYGVESSRDLDCAQLLDLCNRLDLALHPPLMELDKARKRLIAAIGGWLRAMSRTENMGVIRAIACRASGKRRFNEIPLEQLRSLYGAFTRKRKDLAMVERMTVDELNRLTIMN